MTIFSRTCLALTTLAAYSSLTSQNIYRKGSNRPILFRSFSHASCFGVSAAESAPKTVSFLDATSAKSIDVKLMNSPGFTLDQLMELAGLSVATATQKYVDENIPGKKRVLILCGPGNNGGDGLVAARHLRHFGMQPTVIYPKPGRATIFTNLLAQLKDLGIQVTHDCPAFDDYDIIVDALFGFSFAGPAKPPFFTLIQALAASHVPVLSVDVPSGWSVDGGDVHKTGFKPAAVISLTAPKRCMQEFDGVHYLGGR
ncbi:unnamed protein product, partial [Symbiodinium microadriaticum]